MYTFTTNCLVCNASVYISEGDAKHSVPKICSSCRDAIMKIKEILRQKGEVFDE